jgi:hypothetical protein
MSKRKAHNPLKRLLTMSRHAVQDLCLSLRQSTREDGVMLRKYKTGAPVNIGPSLAQSMNDCTFHWAILLIVYVRESNGKSKRVTEWIRLASAYCHSQIDGFAREAHKDLIAKATAKTRPDCLQDVAWIALPVPPKFVSEAEDEKLIEQLLGLME